MMIPLKKSSADYSLIKPSAMGNPSTGIFWEEWFCAKNVASPLADGLIKKHLTNITDIQKLGAHI